MRTMEDVLKYAVIQLVAIIVYVTLDIHSILTIMLVMVRTNLKSLNHSIIFIDINECASGIDDCDHSCFNTVGSYVCDCNVGYVLDTDGSNCIG